MHLLRWIHHVCFPLALGGLIYVVHFLFPLPNVIVHHLPDLLWAYALMSSIMLLWSGRSDRRRIMWVGLVILAGPAWEYLQYSGAIPGTGDMLDILAYLIGSISAWIVILQFRDRQLFRINASRQMMSMVVLCVFALAGMATSLDDEFGYIDISVGLTLEPDALIVTNKNRFALQEYSLEMLDHTGYHFWSGETIPGLGADTVPYASFSFPTPDSTVIRDSIKRIHLTCRVTEGKYGVYVERFD